MNRLTPTEENYLKAVYVLSGDAAGKVPNRAVAGRLGINPATVTEMIRKLRSKRLIDYSRAQGVRLTRRGNAIALQIVRKHRLWETFLAQALGFSWDEVHEIAEQSEHLQSEKLVERLDRFLGHPAFDPHGDPIPDRNGRLPSSHALPLSERTIGKGYRLVGISDHSPGFLKLLNKLNLAINDVIDLTDIQDFDKSMDIVVREKGRRTLSHEVCCNLLVVS